MPVIKYNDIAFPPVQADDVTEMSGGPVIGKAEGWSDHTLRVFRLGPDGHSPHHEHDWEHVNYVMKGRGRLRMGDRVYELTPGDFAYVPANTKHQYENPHDDDFEFICIVPNRGHPQYEEE